MRTKITYLAMLWMGLSSAAFAQKAKRNKGLIQVRGLVTSTADYCGGAAPSEEMLADLKKPSPLANKVILVKYGVSNTEISRVVKRIVTNTKGEFSITLKKGYDYVFVEEWKGLPYKLPQDTEWIKWDASCYKKGYETPDFILRKNKPLRVVKMNFHKRCFYDPYCGTYSGPLPP